MAKITIWAMQNNPLDSSEGLFDLLTLPESINTQDCIDTIMMRCGEFEVLYPNFGFFRDAIGLWGRKYYDTFDKWSTVLDSEYNPLENYDRQETYSGTAGNSKTIEDNYTDSTHGLYTSNVTDVTSSGDTAESRVPFTNTGGESAYIPERKTETSGSSDSKTNTDMSTTHGATTRERVDSGDDHTSRIHGNIGVTTSQQMLQSELDLRRFILLDQIADLFVKEFCVCVY